MTNLAPKIAIIYHSKDGDGILSALLLAEAFTSNCELEEDSTNIKLFGYNYEAELKFEKYLFEGNFDKIIFADCTPPKEWFSKNKNNHLQTKEIWIFDHHAPRYKEIKEYFSDVMLNLEIHWVFDEKKSASKIIWDSFFNTNDLALTNKVFNLEETDFHPSILQCLESKNLSNLVDQIDKFDMWTWWDNYVKFNDADPTIFYWGLFSYIMNQTKSGDYASKYPQETMIKIVLESSLVNFVESHYSEIYATGNEQYKQELWSAKSLKIVEKNGFVIVGAMTNPFVTKRVYEEFPDSQFVLYFRIDERNDPESFKLSFRSINMEYDVANIAKVMFGNGGGHKTASGSGSKAMKFFEVVNSFNANNY